VAVTLGGQTVSGGADARGKWRMALPPPAGGPYILKVSSTTASAAATSWSATCSCARASRIWNSPINNSTNAIGALQAPNDQLRYLNVPKNSAATPQDELNGPAAWTRWGRMTVGAASAVCYYMARDVQASYQIPVGFIHASWGGTTIQSWIGAESLATLGDYRAGIAGVAQYGADRAAGMRAEKCATRRGGCPRFVRRNRGAAGAGLR
jgi:sialate O-acetylesterase